jgi:hypothetical protein
LKDNTQNPATTQITFTHKIIKHNP